MNTLGYFIPIKYSVLQLAMRNINRANSLSLTEAYPLHLTMCCGQWNGIQCSSGWDHIQAPQAAMQDLEVTSARGDFPYWWIFTLISTRYKLHGQINSVSNGEEVLPVDFVRKTLTNYLQTHAHSALSAQLECKTDLDFGFFSSASCRLHSNMDYRIEEEQQAGRHLLGLKSNNDIFQRKHEKCFIGCQ